MPATAAGITAGWSRGHPSRVAADVREEPADKDRGARQTNHHADWQHDHRHSETEADDHHHKADDNGQDMAEYALYGANQ